MTPLLFVFGAALLIVANAAKVPSDWKVCKRSLPPAEYDPCIRDALESVAQTLTAKGAPSLSVLPMEPLKITSLEITHGTSTGPVAIDLTLKNVEMANLKTVEFGELRHKDAEKFKIGADIKLKKPLVVTGDYELSGKVLVLPIKGKGKARIVFDDVAAAFDLAGAPFKKGKEEYVNVTIFDIKFDSVKGNIALENLFDGNKELGDNMNKFLNENWDILLAELKPTVVETLSVAFKSIANQIFSQIPYKDLMPK